MQVYVDGHFVPAEEARVSVFDHGFLYGDGVFEGIRVYDGNIFRLQQHVQRLYASAQCILLTVPLSREAMSAAIVETVRRRELPNQYVRVVVSRGAGDLGLDPRLCRRPSVIIIADTISMYAPHFYTSGLELVTVFACPTALTEYPAGTAHGHTVWRRLRPELEQAACIAGAYRVLAVRDRPGAHQP